MGLDGDSPPDEMSGVAVVLRLEAVVGLGGVSGEVAGGVRGLDGCGRGGEGRGYEVWRRC